ncbi:MAG TPA: IS1634 family transposase [Eubacteriaceae bacterium]|nr:IS1634 family transposase [Eubacteriaceae bacterium]
MRLSISKSKNSTSLYVIKSTYNNGVRSSKIVEKLGTYDDLLEKLDGRDPIEWAKEYIEELNKKEKENKRKIMVAYAPNECIPSNEQRSFNGGYLFLQKIYHELGIDKIASDIADKYKFTFDLNEVLSRLLFARILYPSSKLATHQHASNFIEKPDFDLHHIYRALEVIAKETDFIQSSLYKNSLKVSKRNTDILYYDCTNYFFEIEQEEGLKQYGYSKEHRPNPIVQMGLFMDGDGIPLAFSIDKGNTNEQKTLIPLEKKILKDFDYSKFVVCTDAGLASNANRKFNDKGSRAFITTQSIKKLKKHLKEWALDPEGWHLQGSNTTFNLSDLEESAHTESIFYKERWIKENDLEQKLIVTYSIKHKNYQRNIRNAQIERAHKAIDTNCTKIKKANQNDYKRFIKKTACTPQGEVAEKELYSVDMDVILKEQAYDGFYGVCTNLEDDASQIIKVNKMRWKIEECFRIMKTEFKARPVYLSRDDRIKAHFTTCFMSLVVYRLLEKRLKEKFTCNEIIHGLKDMNFLEIDREGYVPTYTRNAFTDTLHETFGFRTDYQIVKTSEMKKILKQTKK